MNDALRRIEDQLDRMDRALTEGRLDELELEEWGAPDGQLPPDQASHLHRLLDRVQATIARVEAARADAAAALDELRRRRSAARAYLG